MEWMAGSSMPVRLWACIPASQKASKTTSSTRADLPGFSALQVLAAEERAHLLADQLEEERQLHAQVLESREGELTARWERALEAAQGDRSTLQQALDLANRQLHAAHRDMETLRLQVQHLRLGSPASMAAAPAAVRPAPAARPAVAAGAEGDWDSF